MKNSNLTKNPSMAKSYEDLLTEAFDAVKPSSHWKDQIVATVTVKTSEAGTMAGLIAHAVSHFTATEAKIQIVSLKGGLSLLVVEADGYRAGPAGDC